MPYRACGHRGQWLGLGLARVVEEELPRVTLRTCEEAKSERGWSEMATRYSWVNHQEKRKEEIRIDPREWELVERTLPAGRADVIRCLHVLLVWDRGLEERAKPARVVGRGLRDEPKGTPLGPRRDGCLGSCRSGWFLESYQ